MKDIDNTNNIRNTNINNTFEKINEKELIKGDNNNHNNNNYKNIVQKKEDISNLEIYNNKIIESESQVQATDYLIKIQYCKLLCIPYFYFGNIFHFYFSCQSFSSNPIKLSNIPTPPFAIIRSECKNVSL